MTTALHPDPAALASRPFHTVLIANRGEIAVRVIRTLRRLGIRSVAVYSDADRRARHVQEADTAIRLGPASAKESYLDIGKVLDAARRTAAQAIHPGYGFLSENTLFAAACDEAGVVFIGPSARAIKMMGDKITAKTAVGAAGVPVVPGIARPGLTDAELIGAARDVGYPVLVKPSAGGGGKGMRMVENAADLPEAIRSARRESASAFGDDTLFLERFILSPRHIEVQIIADQHGSVIHLGERECSLQRRHQKVIEEAPSPLLDSVTRDRIGTAACNTARSVDYTGAGTVEFIVSADRPDEFFFMEMNTRLQVEHPVTEAVTGLDLVEWQLRVASGEPLGFGQDDITMSGHAIEARVYAEDPARGFLPTGGRVLATAEPAGPGVRVDSGVQSGTEVSSNYDPMLSKIIAHGPDRASALLTLDRALAGTAVLGVGTNIEFLRFLLADEDVQAGNLDTGLLDRRLVDFTAAHTPDEVFIAGAALHLARTWPKGGVVDLWAVPSGWRVGDTVPIRMRLVGTGRTVHVHISGTPDHAMAWVESEGDDRASGRAIPVSASVDGTALAVTVDGTQLKYLALIEGHRIWLSGESGTWELAAIREVNVRGKDAAASTAEVTSPMPGTVIAVRAANGTKVTAGAAVVVVEAMKMEHTLTAPIDGTVELRVKAGDQVKVDQVLATIVTTAQPTGTETPVKEDAK